MSRNSKIQQESHAIAIARWEDNRATWLRGGFFGLASKRPRLQDLIGQGGTLWIVVSRVKPDGGRLYSLSFRLGGCRSVTYDAAGGFGRYGVEGDPLRSALMASNNAKLLLLSLRFQPNRPIRSAVAIGQSLQTPRRLNAADVALLQEHAAAVRRWSVFLSYDRRDLNRARRLSESLARLGINLFRDLEALRAGQHWWPTIQDAIRNSRCMILLIGKHTHTSHWVRSEVECALGQKSVAVIPILAGGDFADWSDVTDVGDRHALVWGVPSWSQFVRNVADSALNSVLSKVETSSSGVTSFWKA